MANAMASSLNHDVFAVVKRELMAQQSLAAAKFGGGNILTIKTLLFICRPPSAHDALGNES